MNEYGKPAGYGKLTIWLHWLMLALFIATYACIELKGFFPKGSAMREGLKSFHFSFGLSIFCLVWIRLLALLTGPRALLSSDLPKWQTRLEVLMKISLYLLMICMPVAGWIALNAAGKQLAFFGLPMPNLTGESRALFGQVIELHESFGTAGYFLIGLHAAAALFHHYILRDNTLRRMRP